ncbi:MAG: hypothetical protein BGN96_03400 [Bacteroidales bacterium 45-6]|nr:MAG: hypothetical protein BGN96_03400 [Bacteroidales bacterium 45-6]
MEEKIEVFENDDNQSQADFYRKFKEELNQAHTFPSNYVFKFIVPAQPSNVAMLHAIFENSNASFSSRDSSNGKYTSTTVKLLAKSADEIINYYQEVATIKGVMML